MAAPAAGLAAAAAAAAGLESSFLREVGVHVIDKMLKHLPFDGLGLDGHRVLPLLEQLASGSCMGGDPYRIEGSSSTAQP